MSNRKKKFKMKKPLTQKEQERRRQIRENRAERKRIEKKKKRSKVLSYTALFLVLFGLFIVFWIIDMAYGFIFTGILIAIAFLLCDNSGIRNAIFSHYPDKFPLAENLKRPVKGQCRTVELCKTGSYYSVLFYFLFHSLSAVWAALWIVCVLVTLFYVIFDEETRLSTNKKKNLSSAGSTTMLTSMIMFLISIENFFIKNSLIIFTIVFSITATVLYLIISSGKGNIIVFVLSAAAFSFSGFCTVNRDFDFSEAQFYTVVIEGKHSSSGKYRHYDLHVEDWNGSGETISVDVSSDDFYELDIGDEIIIRVNHGALGMEYYDYAGMAD